MDHIIWNVEFNYVHTNLTGTQVARKKKRQQQRRIPTNDELLYDPEEDDRDQEWVDSQRRA